MDAPILIHGDCLQVLMDLPDTSVDMILCDPPYGTTRNHWDTIVPLDKMWEIFHRIAKPDACIAIHCDGMYMAQLMMSNATEWRYNLVWDKGRGVDFLNAARKPLNRCETIAIFYRKTPVYHPQYSHGEAYLPAGAGSRSTNWGGHRQLYQPDDTVRTTRYPTTLLQYNYDTEKLHPTQKPVALEEWLIRSYTDPGDLVLDPFMGSGSTGVAAVHEGRRFVGVEQDPRYYDIARARISGEPMRLDVGL